MKTATYLILLFLALSSLSAFADDDESMIEIGNKPTTYDFTATSEVVVSSDTHMVTPFTDNVVKVTEKSTGKEMLVGTNSDKKQAILDVIVAAQLPVGGLIVSTEFLRTVEIGVEAGLTNGTYYGTFTNLHVIKFNVDEVQSDIYFSGHYRQRINTAKDCAILVECYGHMSGPFGDLRIGIRQTGTLDDDRWFVAYEVGYGKFLNGGGKYEQAHPDYVSKGHHAGDLVPHKNLVLRVVFGFRLFTR